MGDDLRTAAVAAAKDALLAEAWDDGRDISRHVNHQYHWGCALCARDVDRIVPVALDAADKALRELADPSLGDRIAELEQDNEGLSKLIDAYKRVEVMSRRGFVLVRGPAGTDECGCVLWNDQWVKAGHEPQPAGSFDRDVADEIHQAYEGATR